MKSLWDELKEFQPTTTCTCDAMKIFLDYYNQNQVLQFLTGLNESFSSVRAQILLNEAIPNLSRVFAMIIQEECQRSLGSADTIPLATATNSQPTNPPRAKKPRPSCSKCDKPGHLVEKCYFLHGFPLAMGTKRDNIKGKQMLIMPVLPRMMHGHSLSSDLSQQCQHLISFLSQQLGNNPHDYMAAMAPTASNLAGSFSECGDLYC
ncbi:uncharacterized protein LOC133030936 [Cannabis sativa]|uniref:uncharacterized protein LOC133030936 n=1 Tax=Cannabis sativa TaxID=3483 RepID=UPI0029CA3376|nr:uncharacterized protein LOC133030936 [Cannabis sativa]